MASQKTIITSAVFLFGIYVILSYPSQKKDVIELIGGGKETKIAQFEEKLKSNEEKVNSVSKVVDSPPQLETDASVIARYRQYGNRSYEELYKAQRHFCGELCDMSTVAWRDVDLTYSAEQLQEFFVKKNVNCDRLFLKEAEEFLEPVAFEWPPPQELPLQNAFTFNGKLSWQKWYLTRKYSGGNARVSRWTREAINASLAQLSLRRMSGTYGTGPTNFFADVLKEVDLTGKHVMVIGSEKPWVEVAALAAGARKVTTLEYGKIISEVPEIDTMTPNELNERYRQGIMPEIDVAISFSSLEHSGLGRYGDGINPWGDLITVAKMSCVVKQKTGHVLFAVPSGSKDYFYYNAHRVYGPNRWPLFLTNWWPEKMWKEKTTSTENGIVYARNERV